MTMSPWIAALHFLGAFGVVATVFCEWLIFNRHPTHAEARLIQRCDAWYGFSAIAAVAAGVLRVYWFEKGSAFYLGNSAFIAKIVLFATVGLISIYPTVRFIRWRKETRANLAPAMTDREFALIRWALRAELLLLVAIVVCASLMAKGIEL